MAVIVNAVYLFVNRVYSTIVNRVFWYKHKTHTNIQSEKLYIISDKQNNITNKVITNKETYLPNYDLPNQD